MDGIQNFDAVAHTRLMNVNLLAVIELTHLATPELEKTKGCVINVSSVRARSVVCARDVHQKALKRCPVTKFPHI